MMNSSKPINIIARLDANDDIGMAHGVRVKQILSMLSSPINLQVYGVGAELNHLFPKQTTQLETAMSEKNQAEFIVAEAQKMEADYLLIDQPHLSELSYKIFEEAGIKTIIFDDYGAVPFGHIIFNGTVLDSYHNYPNMKDKSNIHAGAEFALVNPIFAQNKWHDNADNNLIVVIGGGERAKNWAFWLLGADGPLSALKNAEITMVVGASFSEFEKLNALAAGLDATILQALDQNELAKLLSQHSAALTTGGMIVYEALAVGVPTLTYPQEDNLISEAKWFGKHEALINLGQGNAQNKQVLLTLLNSVFKNNNLRLKLSKNANEIIDGQGMKRVAALMDKFIESSKISEQAL